MDRCADNGMAGVRGLAANNQSAGSAQHLAREFGRLVGSCEHQPRCPHHGEQCYRQTESFYSAVSVHVIFFFWVNLSSWLPDLRGGIPLILVQDDSLFPPIPPDQG